MFMSLIWILDPNKAHEHDEILIIVESHLQISEDEILAVLSNSTLQ